MSMSLFFNTMGLSDAMKITTIKAMLNQVYLISSNLEYHLKSKVSETPTLTVLQVLLKCESLWMAKPNYFS